MYGHKDLHWKDNRVHLDSRATGYSIVRDETYPIMWRVRHPALGMAHAALRSAF
jgi:hypothetical protein